ncbi:MAG: hypothetical protein IKJ43_03605 [Bacilli bacterium]|nr:hypothetical protein [Bacilli bacterium]
MESKHKNALIGALLAVVFVMAVGYAAFAQQLTINGTAEITSSWDIHYDHSQDTVDGQVVTSPSCVSGMGGTTCGSESDTANPYGTITYTTDTDATISVKLVQPGDKVTFYLKPKNFGTGLNATGTMSIADTTTSGYTGITLPATTTGLKAATVATKDHIQFTVTPTFDSSLAPGEYDTIKVEAEYLSNQTTNEVIPQTKAGIKVSIDYTQVS